ncbi:hypothetical protein [Flexistipes sinusarabici]|uniref:hypothetical protein n=1 Tax=Flexistipes sinusarabici TaxID=2352 RepID=UPI0023572C1A|nr:hypothetical protein [Flexistipes sinusarabici]
MQAKRKDTPPQKANGSSFSRLDKIKKTAEIIKTNQPVIYILSLLIYTCKSVSAT